MVHSFDKSNGPCNTSPVVKILVVDDEQPIRLLCEDLLGSLGYEVVLAADGAVAVSMLSEHDDIDIVITDLKMPGMSGMEVLGEIEKNYSHIGVIILTGYASIDNTIEAMRLGAVNLVRKPFNLEELLAAVDRTVAKIQTRSVNHSVVPSVAPLIDERLKELEVLHSEFLSVTSHELLTPLTPVVGYVESLLEGDFGPLADDQKEALDIISSEIDKLRGTIANVLRIKELAEDNLVSTSMLVEPAEMIEGLIAVFSKEAASKHVRLTSSYSGEHRIYTDPHKLSDIVKELISNGVRFSKKDGFVLVKSSCDGEELHISVEDNGIGISEQNLGNVFDKFYRVHKGEARNFGGIGLGLTVVKGLVENLGGTISISSVIDKGTIVHLALPVSLIRKTCK